jgi:hypothetical protein
MPRALALFALSVFVSLTVTAVVTLIARPDARSAMAGVAIRCRGKGEEVAA